MKKNGGAMSINGRAVLVTTQHRGVFFGYVDGDEAKEKVRLTKVRNILSWDAECRGFGGLAANGPTKGCRIGPSMPTATLYDVTGIFGCTEESVKRFEDAPWTR